MYRAVDIANFIEEYCKQINEPIGETKLHKLLYFVQAYSLTMTEDKAPCFSDRIEAWDYGPVVASLYHMPVIRRHNESSPLDEQTKKVAAHVVDMFAGKTATQLEDLTHGQAPWNSVYVKGANNEISCDAIRSHYHSENDLLATDNERINAVSAMLLKKNAGAYNRLAQ